MLRVDMVLSTRVTIVQPHNKAASWDWIKCATVQA